MIKLNRRLFLVGGCCAAHSMTRLTTARAAQVPSFKCGTPTTVDAEDMITLVPYSNEDDTISFKKNISDLNLTPYGTAFVKDRWHLTDGLKPNSGKIALGVYFLNGSPDQQDVAKTAAGNWISGPLGKLFELDFSVSQQQSHIRIAFDPKGGNWSNVGRQCLRAPKSAQTMSIESVVDFVIEHEFGHTWCLQHEHQFPGAINWIESQVIADMQAEQGWSPAMTRAQMLTPLGKGAICIGDPHFNPDSIMLYPIKDSWNTNGFSRDWNTKISDGDFKCLAGIYNFKI